MRVLGDRYELGPVLGEGGMGVVHRGLDRALERPVAIKLVRDGNERFVLEARQTALIRHPAVVEVFDVGHDGGDAFLVMELLEGEPLETRLARAPLDAREAFTIGARVCEGLGAAHALQIVHRDVKPANVFLLASGDVKVVDFGIAKRAGAHGLTEAGMLVGTLLFMSPEQIRGEALDGRSDLYALGALLYTALAGAPPFDSDNAATVIHGTLNLPPPSFGGPAAIEAAVLRLLEKEPRHRPADAAAARKMLLDALDGAGPSRRGEIVLDGPTDEVSLELDDRPPPAPLAPIVIPSFQAIERAAMPLPEPPSLLATIPPELSKRVAFYSAFAVFIGLFFHASALPLVGFGVLACLGLAAYLLGRRS